MWIDYEQALRNSEAANTALLARVGELERERNIVGLR